MSNAWVVNASPIIVLAKVGRLELLNDTAHPLALPRAVMDEIMAGPMDDPARRALLDGWCAPPVEVNSDDLVLEWGLGAGETAVLSLARQTRAVAVIDDGAARAAARALGIRHVGTLGVVLRARVAGRVASAAALLAELRRAGMRIDDRIVAEALRRTTGEAWPFNLGSSGVGGHSTC